MWWALNNNDVLSLPAPTIHLHCAALAAFFTFLCVFTVVCVCLFVWAMGCTPCALVSMNDETISISLFSFCVWRLRMMWIIENVCQVVVCAHIGSTRTHTAVRAIQNPSSSIRVTSANERLRTKPHTRKKNRREKNYLTVYWIDDGTKTKQYTKMMMAHCTMCTCVCVRLAPYNNAL